MPRASNNVQRTKRRKKILKAARGYRGSRSKLYMPAKETLERALQYAYRDRAVVRSERGPSICTWRDSRSLALR